MLRWMITPMILVTAARLWAAEPAPPGDDQNETALRHAEECLLRLQKNVDLLAARENEAVQSNELERAQCIRQKYTTAAGLLSAMKPVHQRLPLLAEEDEPGLFQEELDRLLSACSRSEELLTAAQSCGNESAVSPRTTARRRARVRDGLTASPRPDRATDPEPTGPRASCFRQERLACLVIQAMELETRDDLMPTPCTDRLARQGIKPLDEWDTTRCVSLDDFVVVVARALNLPVEDPDEPASYQQALRDDGLPVELLMSPRSTQPERDVSEDQARAFFASGYAGTFGRHPPHP